MEALLAALEVPELLGKVLVEALHKLEVEASGFVSMADPANHGNTNIAVLKHWIENAQQALKEWEGSDAEV